MIGIGHLTDKYDRGNGSIGNTCEKTRHAHHHKGSRLGHHVGHDVVKNSSHGTSQGTANDH